MFNLAPPRLMPEQETEDLEGVCAAVQRYRHLVQLCQAVVCAACLVGVSVAERPSGVWSVCFSLASAC
jgi:hypothetical protein